MVQVISFFHGRKDPREEMQDWGFDGPKIIISTFAFTYGFLRIFNDDCHECDINEVEGLIEIDGAYYGDYQIWEDKEFDSNPALQDVELFGTTFKGIPASVTIPEDERITVEKLGFVVEPKKPSEHFGLTDDEWIDQFKPVEDPESKGSLKYLTKDEIEKAHPHQLWTLMTNDDGLLCISNGLAYVNRLEYIMTEKLWDPNNTYYVAWEEEEED